MKLDSLISFKEIKHKILCLFYHYRHLNDIDLTNVSLIDLITHRVTLKFDTKSANNEKQCQATSHSTVKLWCLYSKIACKVVYFTLCIFLDQFDRVMKLFTRSRLTECKVSQSFRSEFKFTDAQLENLTKTLDDWKWLRYD